MSKMLTAMAVAVAALTSLSFGGTPTAKTYRIDLPSPSKIGTHQLPAGPYRLVVDPESVRIVEVKTGNAIDVPAKVETAERKFDRTTFSSGTVDGATELRAIRLGGTRILIEFR